jgi:predicted ATPase
MLATLAIANHRSLHELILPLGPLNVVSGENGSGKSSSRRGEAPIQGLAPTGSRSLRLGFAAEELSYCVDLGYPIRAESAFDPEIKTECIWAGPVLRPASMLVERHGASIKVRQDSGQWRSVADGFPAFDSMCAFRLRRTVDPVMADSPGAKRRKPGG